MTYTYNSREWLNNVYNIPLNANKSSKECNRSKLTLSANTKAFIFLISASGAAAFLADFKVMIEKVAVGRTSNLASRVCAILINLWKLCFQPSKINWGSHWFGVVAGIGHCQKHKASILYKLYRRMWRKLPGKLIPVVVGKNSKGYKRALASLSAS